MALLFRGKITFGTTVTHIYKTDFTHNLTFLTILLIDFGVSLQALISFCVPYLAECYPITFLQIGERYECSQP